jgi:hypothetical protein
VFEKPNRSSFTFTTPSGTQVFMRPDDIAMDRMSGVRVAWMIGVARGIQHKAVCGGLL